MPNEPTPGTNLTRLTLAEQTALFLRRYRETFNLSQREIAEATHLTQAAVAKLEAGTANPTLATIEKLASGLHLEASLSIKVGR